MSLVPGARLGPYEIVGLLGAGGMGEVYRATDTRLKRDVAVKVLPASFTSDRDRLARFEREAQLLAQLHHPNIASIFGLEESGGVRALIMELVDGPTLAERLAQGALPLEECLANARQIAEALEEAHDKGIIHRDLKPQNIKITPDGKVKVLDFGLAKAMDPAAGASSPAALTQSPTLMNSPTMTAAHPTQLGVILGTAAYMSPEQARGKPVDRRADIWAFGVVLHEMLTGKPLFAGETVTDTFAAVLTRPVDTKTLPAATPASIRRLLRRCLERDPKSRLRDIGEARLILAGKDDAEPEPADESVAVAATPASRRSRWLLPALAFLAGAALVAAIALGGWRAQSVKPTPTIRLSIALPPGEQVTTAPAISPDGQTIAYVAGRSAATSRLYVRGLNDFAPRPVDSSASATWPFFAPDGRSVAFFSTGKLWRAPISGGSATALAPVSRGFGGSWGADGKIVFAPSLNDGLWSIPAEGGKAEQLTKPDDADRGYAHVAPQILPGGDILFTFWGKTFYTALLAAKTGTWSEVIPASATGRVGIYAESGQLLIGDATADLLATPWRPGAAPASRPETVVLQNVYWIPGTDRSWIAVSASGTAVYVPGTPALRHLVWVDRAGQVTEIPGEPDQITHAAVSRDGKRIVHNGRMSMWVKDVESGTRTRIVSEVRTWAGGWLPGDEKIVLSSNKSGDWDLYTIRAGGGELEPLLVRPRTQHPVGTAPDGSVVFLEYSKETGLDIWTLSPDGKATPLVTSPFQDSSPSVSPDGRYVAYISDESGRNDVYAIPFSGKGERVMVSIDGGTGPVWSRDGRELFYRAGDDLMSVEVRSTNPLALGARHRLLDVSAFEPQFFHEFDVSADGKRFLFIRAEPDSRPTRLDVILNWFPELSQKVPPK